MTFVRTLVRVRATRRGGRDHFYFRPIRTTGQTASLVALCGLVITSYGPPRGGPVCARCERARVTRFYGVLPVDVEALG